MAVKLKSGFEILRYSDLNYEGMTAEIQYKGEQVAQINMDKGLDNLEMEIFTEFVQSAFKPIFQLDDFLEAVSEAKKILREYEE
ncbi:hypothetical protein [Sessilibacter corallicola]|uniref:Uncharacterized protein n=1 Tax=Sessilibacter corallicola TaxID=2904075 RepID=A0ABQ0A9I2_9GAMM